MAALSRRSFLQGKQASQPDAARPPWALAEPDFLAACDQCGACQWTCPEGVIGSDAGGYPVMDFSKGACVFCGGCASACERDAFGKRSNDPWAIKAVIGAACLSFQGVTCRVCGDFCEERAIRFSPTLGGAARPQVRLDDCTGCGACAAPCPTAAITIAALPAV